MAALVSHANKEWLKTPCLRSSILCLSTRAKLEQAICGIFSGFLLACETNLVPVDWAAVHTNMCTLPLTPAPLVQVFYDEFGRLMMHQPVIGSDFTTYAPIFLVPYVVLLTCNIFNRTGDHSLWCRTPQG